MKYHYRQSPLDIEVISASLTVNLLHSYLLCWRSDRCQDQIKHWVCSKHQVVKNILTTDIKLFREFVCNVWISYSFQLVLYKSQVAEAGTCMLKYPKISDLILILYQHAVYVNDVSYYNTQYSKLFTWIPAVAERVLWNRVSPNVLPSVPPSIHLSGSIIETKS